MSNQEQRTPEEQLVIQHAENVSIVEKLLGWKRDRADDVGRPIWLKPATVTRREEHWYTPSFTTWQEAGLILEALDAKNIGVEVGNFANLEEHWYCDVEGHGPPVPKASTAPLAVRAAALIYIRSLL